MKKNFETPIIEIEMFGSCADICTVSNPEGTGIWEGYDDYTESGNGGVEIDDFDW